MRPACVVEAQVSTEMCFRLGHAVIGAQIHLFVLRALPQPLDEHVVVPAALAVHADANVVGFEQAGEFSAGKLAALAGVEDLGAAITRMASRTASRQKSVVSVFDNRQASTLRECQSSTATR